MKKTTRVFEKNRNLSNLLKIQEFPVVSAKENVEEIDCDEFAAALKAIYDHPNVLKADYEKSKRFQLLFYQS